MSFKEVSQNEKNSYSLYKSSICFYKSKCKNGDKCCFAHTNTELEPIKCWYDYDSICNNDNCLFWHKNKESIKDFYTRTEQKSNEIIKENGKKVYKLLPKITKSVLRKELKPIPIIDETNNEINNKKEKTREIVEQIINEEIVDKIPFNIKKYTYENWINQEKNKEIINFENEIKTQIDNPPIYFTEEDNKKENIIPQTIKSFIINKYFEKIEFIEYVNKLKSLNIELLFIEKNNKNYKISMIYNEDKILKLLENDEDDDNNLPF